MKHPLARVALILPLLWMVSCALALAGPSGKRKQAKDVTEPFSGQPVAVLSTPERQVQVFKLSAAEGTDSSYVIVTVDEDGAKQTYGDQKTVGELVAGLARELKSAPGRRCPAAAGWGFEAPGVRSSFCSKSAETERIERAVAFLITTP